MQNQFIGNWKVVDAPPNKSEWKNQHYNIASNHISQICVSGPDKGKSYSYHDIWVAPQGHVMTAITAQNSKWYFVRRSDEEDVCSLHSEYGAWIKLQRLG